MKRFILVLFVSLVSLPGQAKIIERIIAIVGDQAITMSELKEYRKNLKTGGLVDDSLVGLADSKKLLSDEKYLINHLVDEKILDSEVKKREIMVTIERVEQEIRQTTARNGIGRPQLKEALAKMGVSFSDYQAFVKKTLERRQLVEREVSSKIKISDEDVAAYFSKQKGRAEIFEYKISHIFFLVKNGSVSEAKKRADNVLKKVGKSESFEALAKQYSEDPGFTKGGLLGTFKAGELSNEMEAAVRGMTVGDHSGIVKGRNGYHILKLLDRKVVEDPELAAVKEKIRNGLFAQAFQKQFRSWLDQKRRDSFIRINK